jgi:hypothetical protein
MSDKRSPGAIRAVAVRTVQDVPAEKYHVAGFRLDLHFLAWVFARDLG